MWNTNISDGYGNAGYGGGYGGGWGGFGGIGLFGLLGLRGIDDRDRDRRGDDCCCSKMIEMHDQHNDHDHVMDGQHAIQMEVCAAEREMCNLAMELQECCCETQRDILETKFDLSTQILNNRFETAMLGKDIIHDIDVQSCGINRNVDQLRFDQAILAKDAQAQLAACCCTLENKIRDSIDVTKDCCCETQKLMLQIDAKNDLAAAAKERRDLERELDEIRFERRLRNDRDEQNILNNFGTITDSLNKVITALGNTSAA